MYFLDNGNRHDETYSAVRRKKRKMMMMITHYIITRHTHTHTQADRRETKRKKSRESDTHRTLKKNAVAG